MSMSFNGPNGWIEQRWTVYALLRDNVQHHLEDGAPTKESPEESALIYPRPELQHASARRRMRSQSPAHRAAVTRAAPTAFWAWKSW
jgi:hypothetical protein